ncbi:TPA: site-specific integrase [Pseudomonas aeruginosa]|uniref:Site-specific integrase n=1 Tax=Ectopseudomonas oleovorans TaxID=301 RepID=A0A427HIF4_ECTOL|nr:site-specific integrase [Pseudomonas aeruginosa]RRW34385.1 site-specific integrase [Pseudomonas oleovorans]EIU7141932.1 site-specific integrase [Pseudomonas aeruginosa]EKV0186437.1 site-specific integrase [Pseudomonas aeruginosa]EKX5086725.1 site-specific integrase [Pseudomonas aeruginosa]
MKVKRYQFNSLPFVSIVDEADCPIDPYVSCYLNGPLAAKSANTRLRYANELIFVLQYFSAKKINLVERVASGEFISQKEYMQFYEACFLNKGYKDEASKIKSFDMNNKHLRNVIAANQKGIARVAGETLQGRVRRLRQFLVWLFEQFHDVINVSEIVRNKFTRLVSKIRLDEEGIGRNRSQKVGDPEESVIPDDVFIRLLEMVQPSSPNNPFKASKIRNYLILNLLVQSGVRRGALAKLKVSDFNFFGTCDQISIYRSGNDSTDTRSEKPNQKTKAHMATVEKALMEHTRFYIDHVRSVFLRAQTHDFLFVSENDSKGTAGLPLSLKAINAIFQKLSRVLGFHVHPHILRHKWNEIIDEKAEKIGVDPFLLEDMRKYAMGWSQNTTMTSVYNDKRLALKVRNLTRSHQDKVDKK